MYPNPKFENVPLPEWEDETLPSAQNEPEYGNDEIEPTLLDLYKKRHAHEANARLGYRNPDIDRKEIERITKEIVLFGGSEEGYKEYLQNRPTPHE